MIRFVRWSTWLYRGILLLYPYALRFDFGSEMASVFAEDLSDAWKNSGLTGVAVVWWRALAEIPWVSLPGRMRFPALQAPAVGMMVQLVMVGGVLALATFAQQLLPNGLFAHDVLRVVTLRP